MKVRCVHKILKHNDKYVMFYSPWCSYSNQAMDYIKTTGEDYRFYNIDSIPNGMELILNEFNKVAAEINFDPNHKTRPIIFYKGKFIGGSANL